MSSVSTYTSVPSRPISLRSRPTIPKPCSGMNLLGRHCDQLAIRKRKTYTTFPVLRPRLHTGFGPRLSPMLEDAPMECPRNMTLEPATPPPVFTDHNGSAGAGVPDTLEGQPRYTEEELEGQYIVELQGRSSTLRLAERMASLPCIAGDRRLPPETNCSLYWATNLGYLRQSRQTGMTPFELYDNAIARRLWPLKDAAWGMRDEFC